MAARRGRNGPVDVTFFGCRGEGDAVEGFELGGCGESERKAAVLVGVMLGFVGFKFSFGYRRRFDSIIARHSGAAIASPPARGGWAYPAPWYYTVLSPTHRPYLKLDITKGSPQSEVNIYINDKKRKRKFNLGLRFFS